ncbi:hypothetical protein [Streptomyces sp. NP-1717]|uniref:hypothetical protein n=1 Tax=unclassified Streptomyces TaxID=2593676 RepID=UPI001F5C5F43|nr:hypothetical protein [Streptomyces sp. NP-1717]MCI3225116.1 hypothetical protein [Streptomyces sp. NP-1717]WTA73621.1 hypothetical protein OG705_12400 [Streptomyces sp. NBC_00838]
MEADPRDIRPESVPVCADCGWPVESPLQEASRHTVTEGTVVYTRCACGRVRVWLEPRGGGAPRLVVGAAGVSYAPRTECHAGP